MQLRPYQSDAIDAVNSHLAEKDTHAVVSIPTAGGKTVIFASMIRDWLITWPGTRAAIIAHRQELLTQAEEKLKAVWPLAPTGVWSAGLKRREANYDVLIAGISSVYKRATEFRPFDIIIIDEAHLVPNSADTMYRRFLEDARLCNPHVRYLGFTATPYRLDGGALCGEGKLFDEVCFEADIGSLISDGYLCPLRTKETETVLDATGVGIRQGDFVPGQLETAVNTDPLVSSAVAEIVEKGKDRKAWLVFCCGVKHAASVSRELSRHGVHAPVVTGETDKAERTRILRDFDAGKIRAVVNVNVLTTGLDVTRIDMIAMLRPTESTALWVQAVGRGFRLHPGKKDCLVLDFGQNCRRHGPLDALRVKSKASGSSGVAPVKTCPACKEILHAAVRECPCGYLFPEKEPNHEAVADTAPILIATAPTTWEETVDDVRIAKHQKPGKPPSLKVSYVCGLNTHREWVCLEHPGYAGSMGARWWERRFGKPVPATIDDALTDMFLRHKIKEKTVSIRVRRSGKYTEVTDVTLNREAVHALAR